MDAFGGLLPELAVVPTERVPPIIGLRPLSGRRPIVASSVGSGTGSAALLGRELLKLPPKFSDFSCKIAEYGAGTSFTHCSDLR